MYLEKLLSLSCDQSLGREERRALEAKYYAQYLQWTAFKARLLVTTANLGGSQFWDSVCGVGLYVTMGFADRVAPR